MSINPLTHTQLLEQAPALFTEQPHHEVSDKYHFIPTIDVITDITQYGWHPVSVQEASVRDLDKEGFQRHLVRFRHFDDLLNQWLRLLKESAEAREYFQSKFQFIRARFWLHVQEGFFLSRARWVFDEDEARCDGDVYLKREENIFVVFFFYLSKKEIGIVIERHNPIFF